MSLSRASHILRAGKIHCGSASTPETAQDECWDALKMELGVCKGEFAAHVLAHCQSIRRYYMVDPWRHLPDWNKPWNVSDDSFEQVFREAMSSIAFAKDRVTILRGKTTEMIDQVDDESVDFVYVNGDHELRGITLDLLTTWKKVKLGRYLAGDDLQPNIWQHSTAFEPGLVFSTLYFAEAEFRCG